MYPFFVALHVLLCLFLILIIMLQPGKGGDVGAAFGGGGGAGSGIFGPRGPTGLLQRATTIVAVLFMGTTITLALYSNRGVRANANVDDELMRLQQMELQNNGAGDAGEGVGAAPPPEIPEDAPSEPVDLTAPLQAPAPAPAPANP